MVFGSLKKMSLAMPVAAAPAFQASAFAESLNAAHSAAGPSSADAGAPPGPAFAPRSVGAHGRLREESLRDSDRHLTVFMHLSPLAFIWIGPFALAIPLVMWLIRRDESVFADDHGRETVNFLISFIVLHFVLGITIIGIALIPVLWVVACVNIVRGALAASRSEYFRYPVTIRFLS